MGNTNPPAAPTSSPPPDHGPLQWVVDFLLGLPLVAASGETAWPRTDDEAMRQLGGLWIQFADKLNEAMQGMNPSAHDVSASYGGDTGLAFVQSWAQTAGAGDGSAYAVMGNAYELGHSAQNTAMMAEYTRLTMQLNIAITVASILIAMAMAYFTGGASNASIPGFLESGHGAVLAAHQALRSFVQRLGARTGLSAIAQLAPRGALGRTMLRGAAQEIGEEVFIDLTAQSVQIARGHRDGFDARQLWMSGVAGGVAGAAGPVLFGSEYAGGFLLPTIRDRISRMFLDNPSILRNATHSMVLGAGQGIVLNTLGSVAASGSLGDWRAIAELFRNPGDFLLASAATSAARPAGQTIGTGLGLRLRPQQTVAPGPGLRVVVPRPSSGLGVDAVRLEFMLPHGSGEGLAPSPASTPPPQVPRTRAGMGPALAADPNAAAGTTQEAAHRVGQVIVDDVDDLLGGQTTREVATATAETIDAAVDYHRSAAELYTTLREAGLSWSQAHELLGEGQPGSPIRTALTSLIGGPDATLSSLPDSRQAQVVRDLRRLADQHAEWQSRSAHLAELLTPDAAGSSAPDPMRAAALWTAAGAADAAARSASVQHSGALWGLSVDSAGAAADQRAFADAVRTVSGAEAAYSAQLASVATTLAAVDLASDLVNNEARVLRALDGLADQVEVQRKSTSLNELTLKVKPAGGRRAVTVVVDLDATADPRDGTRVSQDEETWRLRVPLTAADEAIPSQVVPGLRAVLESIDAAAGPDADRAHAPTPDETVRDLPTGLGAGSVVARESAVDTAVPCGRAATTGGADASPDGPETGPALPAPAPSADGVAGGHRGGGDDGGGPVGAATPPTPPGEPSMAGAWLDLIGQAISSGPATDLRPTLAAMVDAFTPLLGRDVREVFAAAVAAAAVHSRTRQAFTAFRYSAPSTPESIPTQATWSDATWAMEADELTPDDSAVVAAALQRLAAQADEMTRHERRLVELLHPVSSGGPATTGANLAYAVLRRLRAGLDLDNLAVPYRRFLAASGLDAGATDALLGLVAEAGQARSEHALGDWTASRVLDAFRGLFPEAGQRLADAELPIEALTAEMVASAEAVAVADRSLDQELRQREGRVGVGVGRPPVGPAPSGDPRVSTVRLAGEVDVSADAVEPRLVRLKPTNVAGTTRGDPPALLRAVRDTLARDVRDSGGRQRAVQAGTVSAAYLRADLSAFADLITDPGLRARAAELAPLVESAINDQLVGRRRRSQQAIRRIDAAVQSLWTSANPDLSGQLAALVGELALDLAVWMGAEAPAAAAADVALAAQDVDDPRARNALAEADRDVARAERRTALAHALLADLAASAPGSESDGDPGGGAGDDPGGAGRGRDLPGPPPLALESERAVSDLLGDNPTDPGPPPDAPSGGPRPPDSPSGQGPTGAARPLPPDSLPDGLADGGVSKGPYRPDLAVDPQSMPEEGILVGVGASSGSADRTPQDPAVGATRPGAATPTAAGGGVSKGGGGAPPAGPVEPAGRDGPTEPEPGPEDPYRALRPSTLAPDASAVEQAMDALAESRDVAAARDAAREPLSRLVAALFQARGELADLAVANRAEAERHWANDQESRARHRERMAELYLDAARHALSAAEAYRAAHRRLDAGSTDQALRRAVGAAARYADYCARVAQIGPQRNALGATVLSGRVPGLDALSQGLNARGIPSTPEDLNREIRAGWRWAAGDGVLLSLGLDAGVAARVRFRPGEAVEVADPGRISSELIIGQLLQVQSGSRESGATTALNLGLAVNVPAARLAESATEGRSGIAATVNRVLQHMMVDGDAQRTKRWEVGGSGGDFALLGAVMDVRDASTLFDLTGCWEIQVEAEVNRDVASSRVEPAWEPVTDVRAEVWTPYPYVEPAPANVVHDNQPTTTLFPEHVVTNLSGMTELYGAAKDLLDDHLGFDRTALGSEIDHQVRTLILEELPARMGDSINEPGRLLRPLTVNGSEVGLIDVRTSIDKRGQQWDADLIGAPSTDTWLERLRIAFSPTNGTASTTGAGRWGGGLGFRMPGLGWISGRGMLGRSSAAAINVGSTAIHPSVQRYIGATQAYDLGLTYQVRVQVFGKGDPVGAPPVQGRGHFRMPVAGAHAFGLPVDPTSLSTDPEPPANGVPDMLPPRFLGPDGVPGAGPAIVQDLTGVVENGGIREQVETALRATGWLPALADDGWPILPPDDRRHRLLLDNLRIISELSAAMLEAEYDQAAQDGIIRVLERAGRPGQTNECLVLRIRLEQDWEHKRHLGSSSAEGVVNLDISSATTQVTARASRTRGMGGAAHLNVLGAVTGQDPGSGAGASQTTGAEADADSGKDIGPNFGAEVSWTTAAPIQSLSVVNRVTLHEAMSKAELFAVPHRLVVEWLDPHDGRPSVLAQQTGTARLGFAGDLVGRSDPMAWVSSTAADETPLTPDALRRGTILHLDATGLVDAVRHVLPRLSRPGSSAFPLLTSLVNVRTLIANADVIFDGPGHGTESAVNVRGRTIRGSLDVRAYAGEPRLVAVSDLVMGDITLLLTGHGTTVAQDRTTAVSGTAAVPATGLDAAGARARAERRGQSTIHGREHLIIDAGRTYIAIVPVDFDLRGVERALLRLNRVRRRNVGDFPDGHVRSMVMAWPERVALDLYAGGELSLPTDTVADAIERYLGGRLSLDRHTAVGVLARFTDGTALSLQGVANSTPQPMNDLAERLRVRLEGRGDDDPALPGAAPPLPSGDTLGHGALDAVGLVDENGNRTDLAERVLERIDTVVPGAAARAPGLRQAITIHLAGDGWRHKWDALNSSEGWTHTFPFRGVRDEWATVRLRVEYRGRTPRGPADVILIGQGYLYRITEYGRDATASSAARGVGGVQVPSADVMGEGRTGIARSGTVASSGSDQLTTMNRIGFFDGVTQSWIEFDLTIDVERDSPALNWLRRFDEPERLAGTANLLAPKSQTRIPRDPPETDHDLPFRLPAMFWVASHRAGGLHDEVVEHLEQAGLLGGPHEAVQRQILRDELTGDPFTVGLAEMTESGYGVPLIGPNGPGHFIDVIVTAPRLSSNPADDGPTSRREMGQTDRHQLLDSITSSYGRFKPSSSITTSLGAVPGLTASVEGYETETGFSGDRDETTNSEMADGRDVRATVTYHVTISESSGAILSEFAATTVGEATVAVFDRDLPMARPEPPPDGVASAGRA